MAAALAQAAHAAPHSHARKLGQQASSGNNVNPSIVSVNPSITMNPVVNVNPTISMDGGGGGGGAESNPPIAPANVATPVGNVPPAAGGAQSIPVSAPAIVAPAGNAGAAVPSGTASDIQCPPPPPATAGQGISSVDRIEQWLVPNLSTQSAVCTHGRHCGACATRGNASYPPVDPLDAACLEHHQCLSASPTVATCPSMGPTNCTCDEVLQRKAQAVSQGACEAHLSVGTGGTPQRGHGIWPAWPGWVAPAILAARSMLLPLCRC